MLDYTLPRTFLARHSAPALVSLLRFGCDSTFQLTLLWLLFLCVWGSYYTIIATSRSAIILWVVILIYSGAYFFSALIHPFRNWSMQNCTLVIGPICIGLFALRVCGVAERGIKMLGLLATTQAIFASIIYFSHHDSFVSGTLLRAGGTFGHPTGLYTLMLCYLLPAVGILFSSKATLERTFWAGSVTLMFFALLVTWERAAISGVCISLIWLALKRYGPQIGVLVLSITLCVCVFFTFYARGSGYKNRVSAQGSMDSRRALWDAGWSTFRENPLYGVGLTEFRVTIHSQHTAKEYELMEPKNMFLQWMAEMGISGGILFIAFAISIWRTVCTASISVAGWVGGAWMSIFIASLFDTPFGVADRVCQNAMAGGLLGVTLMLANQCTRKVTAVKVP